ncbi:hypothetical protein Cp87MAT_2220 [Corynebacterium pseudotuberculosis]|nr:Hypothetical protein Cp4202_2092 [Corynebacterium pseudotuberculosis 42/02-A]AEX40609.1 Hypothetical protein Cp3995_2167 [Corynebacterium pseudotuberculosis 3/99-5]AKC74878.1 Hypothetical protein Cp226_2197 [Corynebacterium pseudotuberculosis]AKS14446.1 Hypothetical protein CpE19_2112 [Corynebacterium pseudotuberculosis]ANH26893.1 Hypothetical protein CpMEX9_2164 [Corynebacterium pseudotuberculosis]
MEKALVSISVGAFVILAQCSRWPQRLSILIGYFLFVPNKLGQACIPNVTRTTFI